MYILNQYPLVPGRCGSNFKRLIINLKLRIRFMSISGEIAFRWMPQNIIDDKSTLVQVMACHHMASLNHDELSEDVAI